MRFNYNYYNATSNYKLYASYTGCSIPPYVYKKLNIKNCRQASFKYINFFQHKNNTVKIIGYNPYLDTLFFIYFLDARLNKLHRNKGPAFVEFNKVCEVPIIEKYYKNGIEHRNNNPQEILRYYDGTIRTEIYRKNGLFHREKYPAFINYLKNGNPFSKNYFINGENFRKNDLPHAILFDYDGKVNCEQWLKNNKPHRMNGPAIIFYGNKIKKQWFVNGIKLDLRKFPVFENNKKINKILITNSVIINCLNLDREYGMFLQTYK